MTKEITVKLRNGYEFSLHFTMDVWEALEKSVCLIGDIGEKISEGKDRLRNSAKIAAIMAADSNATEEAIWANLEPRDVRTLNNAITRCISENLAMETETDDEGAVHDVVLEEIEAKKEPAG